MSARSGAFTVWAQPRLRLWPCRMTGVPGKTPPSMSQPSSLCTCASYQETGPVQGWCELMSSSVLPSVVRLGETARVLEPIGRLEKLMAEFLRPRHRKFF